MVGKAPVQGGQQTWPVLPTSWNTPVFPSKGSPVHFWLPDRNLIFWFFIMIPVKSEDTQHFSRCIVHHPMKWLHWGFQLGPTRTAWLPCNWWNWNSPRWHNLSGFFVCLFVYITMSSFRDSCDCKVLMYHVKQLLEIIFPLLKYSQSIKFLLRITMGWRSSLLLL